MNSVEIVKSLVTDAFPVELIGMDSALLKLLLISHPSRRAIP